MSGKSRIEKILENLLGENNVIEPPIGRDEKILYSILNDLEYTDPPHSIFEDLLLAIKTGNVPRTAYVYDNLTRDEKILFCKLNRREYFEPPHSRLERLLIKWLYLDLYLNIDGVPPFIFASNGSPIIDYIISGNTVQSGTPTPDSPIMPQGTGEKTANLCLVSQSNSIYYSTINKYSVSGNSVNITGEALFGFICAVSPNTEYSVSARADKLGAQIRIREYSDIPTEWQTNHVKQSVNIGLIVYNSATFTTDSTTKYLLVTFYVASAFSPMEIYDIMLNTGSTAKPYEPYGYKIPISSANTTTPVYLGEVLSTRRIKKLVLTGEEAWQLWNGNYYSTIIDRKGAIGTILSTHFINSSPQGISYNNQSTAGLKIASVAVPFVSDLSSLKEWLTAQYAAGTPVTVWYALANAETAIVNEPLMKIGNYADSISYEQTVVSIPTVSGRNTFDVLGDVKPSNVELTYAPRAPLLGKRKMVLKK